MKITKETLVRTVALFLVLVNIVLERLGIKLISYTESEVASFVTAVIEVAVIVVAWWKNNSFSPQALKADEFLRRLKNNK